jgi:hypothetical protein
MKIATILDHIDTMVIASGAGFRCFTMVDDFKSYVEKEIIGAVTA